MDKASFYKDEVAIIWFKQKKGQPLRQPSFSQSFKR
jgi:hypothetical protein